MQSAHFNKSDHIYTSHGEKKLLSVVTIVNGRRALGYIKNEKLLGYIYWDDLCQQVYTADYHHYDLPF